MTEFARLIEAEAWCSQNAQADCSIRVKNYKTPFRFRKRMASWWKLDGSIPEWRTDVHEQS
jgi:hypothetical protein